MQYHAGMSPDPDVPMSTEAARGADIRVIKRGKTASLADVAALAGVSAGTVSRVLSRPDMISEATRKRVLEAVERIGYVPNGAARAMAMRRTMAVGALIPRFGTSSFPTMVQALESALARQGYTLLLASPDHQSPQSTTMVRTLLERGVDAIALLGSQHPREVFSLLNAHGTPFVQLWTQDETQGPCVGFDEHQAAAVVIRHLADLGHRRLGFIGGHTRDNERAQARFIGLTRAIAQHGLMLQEDVIIETEYGFQQGFDAMEQIRLRHSDVTAVICGNDYLAAGALSALDRGGVRVPEQLSVISFNDNDFAPFLHPPLTTVHLPIRELGEQGARLLLSRLRNEPFAPMPSLPVSLIVRHSTGPAPR